MKRFVSHYVLGVLAASMLVAPVHAETISFNDVRYVYTQPDFFERGTRAGQFVIKPEVSVETTYDDNIYRTESNAMEDLVTRFRPEVAVNSDWAQHAMNVKLCSNIGRYSDNTAENYSDVNTAIDGRLDIVRGFYLTGSLQYQQNHQDRGIPDTANSVTPTEYSQKDINIALTHDMARIGVTLGTTIKKINYEDNETAGGAPINNEVYNYTQYGVNLKTSYAISEGYKAFIRTTANHIESVNTTPGTDRSSDGYSIALGTSFNPSGKVKGDVYFGYLKQTYDDNTLGSIGGADYGFNVYWQASELVKLKLQGLRSINQSILTNSPGYLQSTVSLGADYQLLRSMILDARISYTENDYSRISRADEISELSLGSRYYFNDYVALKGTYTYQSQDSNAAGGSFDNNRVSIGLVFGL